MLELKNVSLSIGKKTLLDTASARIEARYRVGLIGRNGAGKSSMIKLLLGQLPEDAGSINLQAPLSDIAYLQQSLPDSDLSALNYAKGGDTAWLEIDSRLEQAIADDDGDTIAHCHSELQEIDGYSIESRAAKILNGLGFSNKEMLKPVKSFSGGWQMRLQLARVLLSRAQLYLLDEPTNHLDIDAILWLEQWLNKLAATLVIISHDRDFLDAVCSHTLHLKNKQLKLYAGNYTAFNKQYNLQLEIDMRQAAKSQAQREHMQNFVDRFRAKASKAKQAQSRMKALEKMAESPNVQAENPFHFQFLSCNPLKGALINFDGKAGYDSTTIIHSCRLNVDYGDRIGLIGKNGEGKTTLLKTLAKTLPVLQGDIHHHAKIKIGYFSQQQVDMIDPENTPFNTLLLQKPDLTESMARRYLGSFGFSGDRVFESIGRFSGGEKARLALALLIYKQPNLLLLDEPTNHLDIQMREAFILALQNFHGAMIIVSHDRHFMSSVVNEVWRVHDGSVERFSGSLEDYKGFVLGQAEAPAAKKTAPAPTAKKPATPKEKSDNPKKNRNNKQIKQCESRIARAKKVLAQFEDRLAEEELYLAENKDRLHETIEQHRSAKEKLDTLENKWLELNDDSNE